MCPPRLSLVVTRLLEKAPEARFQSAADLAWTLERLDALPLKTLSSADHSALVECLPDRPSALCCGSRVASRQPLSPGGRSGQLAAPGRQRQSDTVHLDAAGRFVTRVGTRGLAGWPPNRIRRECRMRQADST